MRNSNMGKTAVKKQYGIFLHIGTVHLALFMDLY